MSIHNNKTKKSRPTGLQTRGGGTGLRREETKGIAMFIKLGEGFTRVLN